MPQFENPIFPTFAAAIAGHLTQRGLTPLVGVTESGGPAEAQYISTLLQRQVAGLIFISDLHLANGLDHTHTKSYFNAASPWSRSTA